MISHKTQIMSYYSGSELFCSVSQPVQMGLDVV
jgi:hypothetical protein